MSDYAESIDSKPNFNLESWLYDEITCGCGDPDSAVALVHDTLDWMRRRRAADFTPVHPGIEEIISDERARWFLFYRLDMLNLTEHGGSVPGWLTPFGEQVLDALNLDGYCDETGKGYRSLAIPE